MTIIRTLIIVAAVLTTVSACAERSPGQDVRLMGYDNLYPAYSSAE